MFAIIGWLSSREIPDAPGTVAAQQGKLNLNDLYEIAINTGELNLKSGKQEMFENIINQFI